jgi:hypothetical protein
MVADARLPWATHASGNGHIDSANGRIVRRSLRAGHRIVAEVYAEELRRRRQLRP